MVPGWRALWWALAAAARGRPQVVGELLAVARRGVPMNREWRAMRKRLAAAAEVVYNPAHPNHADEPEGSYYLHGRRTS
jgi:hypothetical protein